MESNEITLMAVERKIKTIKELIKDKSCTVCKYKYTSCKWYRKDSHLTKTCILGGVPMKFVVYDESLDTGDNTGDRRFAQ